jgi:hypothetical protein
MLWKPKRNCVSFASNQSFFRLQKAKVAGTIRVFDDTQREKETRKIQFTFFLTAFLKNFSAVTVVRKSRWHEIGEQRYRQSTTLPSPPPPPLLLREREKARERRIKNLRRSLSFDRGNLKPILFSFLSPATGELSRGKSFLTERERRGNKKRSREKKKCVESVHMLRARRRFAKKRERNRRERKQFLMYVLRSMQKQQFPANRRRAYIGFWTLLTTIILIYCIANWVHRTAIVAHPEWQRRVKL